MNKPSHAEAVGPITPKLGFAGANCFFCCCSAGLVQLFQGLRVRRIGWAISCGRVAAAGQRASGFGGASPILNLFCCRSAVTLRLWLTSLIRTKN